jgi:3-deoxy-D-manno-octulosonate 8-phosphate phosphatase (KDO 8-P phosphatase)
MEFLASDALERARRVKLVVFDVDGVLTDGRLWYGANGEALKAFHAFDGHGVKMLQQAGLETAILSGRDMPAVLERCGLACAPREAPQAVRSVAHCIPSAAAGNGAAREVCEFILQAQGKLARLLRRYRA